MADGAAERQARLERDQANEQQQRYLAALDLWFAQRPYACPTCGGGDWWLLGWESFGGGDHMILLADRFVAGRALLGNMAYAIGRLSCEDCFTVTMVDLGAIVDKVSRQQLGNAGWASTA